MKFNYCTSKEYVLAILEALNKIESYRAIEIFQMSDGFGNLWAPIFDEFRDKGVISDIATPDGYPVNKPYVFALRSEYQSILKKINDDEEERKLRVTEMATAIKKTKHAMITAWISIAIAIASFIVAILRPI